MTHRAAGMTKWGETGVQLAIATVLCLIGMLFLPWWLAVPIPFLGTFGVWFLLTSVDWRAIDWTACWPDW